MSAPEPPAVPDLPSSGLDAVAGWVVEEASPERVVARLDITERHLQPMGLIHGGVYAALAEQVATLGATLDARRRQPAAMAVGVETHTTFLRAGHAGVVLVAEATPRHAGRRTQAWRVVMRDGRGPDGRELAAAAVRLLVVGPLEG